MIRPAGEGKTRWLVGRAFEESQAGNRVVLLSNNPAEYEKFMLYYRTEYSSRCPVEYISSTTDIPYDAVVLVDDLHEKTKKSLFDLDKIKTMCKKIFATAKGPI